MAKFLRIKNVVLNADEIISVTVKPNHVLNAHSTLGIGVIGYKVQLKLRNINDGPSFQYDTEEDAMDALCSIASELKAGVVL